MNKTGESLILKKWSWSETGTQCIHLWEEFEEIKKSFQLWAQHHKTQFIVWESDDWDSSPGMETLFCEHLNQYILGNMEGTMKKKKEREISIFILNKRKK